MPAFNEFNFYQRAYQINQGYGSAVVGTSSIKMGSITSPTYKGLAYYYTKTFYADVDSVVANEDLYTTNYSNYFDTSGPLRLHDATLINNCNYGPAIPKLNSASQYTWDQVCYPSALGDTRDNERYNNDRDGSWVEAGYDSNTQTNYINIYTAIAGTAPRWTNSIACGNNFTYGGPNPLQCRVFTSPSFTSDSVPGSGPPGTVLIAYFAWSTTGNNGSPIFYYELFGWDVSMNTLSSINNGVDLTANYLGFYEEFTYTGRHDMFHTARRLSPQSYDTCDMLTLISNSNWIIQLDVISGAPLNRVRGNAGAYSDVYDIFAFADNSSSSFYTINGKIGLANIIDNRSVPSINVFDGDYRPFPSGKTNIQDDYFYFADDQQSTNFTIVAWSLQIDPMGYFNTINGLRSAASTYTGGPYILKRAVVVSPMQLILGSGPNYGTYPLLRIVCDWANGTWYKSGTIVPYGANSQNEDYIAMFHGFCEDWTSYFDSSGAYTAGYKTGIPIGAGNGHLLTVSSNMTVSLHNHNTSSDYVNEPWSGAPYVHYHYALYLGKASWTTSGSHTSNAYLYINISGGGTPFLIPVTSIGSSTNFSGAATGKLRVMAFNA